MIKRIKKMDPRHNISKISQKLSWASLRIRLMLFKISTLNQEKNQTNTVLVQKTKIVERYSDSRKSWISWGLFSTVDESTVVALVNLWVWVKINYSVKEHVTQRSTVDHWCVFKSFLTKMELYGIEEEDISGCDFTGYVHRGLGSFLWISWQQEKS